MNSLNKELQLSEAFCDNNELVAELNNEFDDNVSNNIIRISLIHKCYHDNYNLYCELKNHLKCPYCVSVHLIYVHHISSTCKNGYMRSSYIQDHSKTCPFLKEYYESKKGIHRNGKILTDSNKMSKNSINDLINRLKPVYKINSHHTQNSKKRHISTSRMSNMNNKNSNSVNKTSCHPRVLMWEHEPNLISKKDDDYQVCAFYGWVRSINRIYKCQPLYEKKKYGEKEIFQIRLNDGSYIYPSPSYIKRSDKNQDYIQHCKEKDKKAAKLIYNKYFICICQIQFTSYQKHPYPDVICRDGKPAMWPYYR